MLTNLVDPVHSLHFLGTGTSSGVPMPLCHCAVCQSSDPKDKRLRSSVLISHNNKNLLIDAGPDLRQQLLNTKPKSIEAVLFTHEHRDHVAGLDDIRPYYFQNKESVKLFGPAEVEAALKRDFHYAFGTKHYPGAPRFSYQSLKANQPFHCAGLDIEALLVMHGSLEIFAYKINHKLAYITDANQIPPESVNKLKNLDVLVLNALRITPHHSHFNLKEALEMVAILKPKRAYFTHISHLLGMHEAVSKQLPDHVALAYDGLEINF